MGKSRVGRAGWERHLIGDTCGSRRACAPMRLTLEKLWQQMVEAVGCSAASCPPSILPGFRSHIVSQNGGATAGEKRDIRNEKSYNSSLRV
ncbi:MAG: hypothetical protein HQ578_05405 [Chloroflexi bacterium]|nr:hypothetical protein [Chloroflexota bacterium]